MPRKKSGEGMTTTAARSRQSAMSTGGMSMSSYKASGSRATCSSSCSAEQIRERAYYIYLERQRTNQYGDPTSDWYQAEQELNGAALTASEV